MSNKHKERCFLIKLANNQRWLIIPTDEDMFLWIKRFASIVKLRKMISPKSLKNIDKRINVILVLKNPRKDKIRHLISSLNRNSYKDKLANFFVKEKMKKFNEELTFFQIYTHQSNTNVISGPVNQKLLGKLNNRIRNNLNIVMMQFILFPAFLQNQHSGGLVLHAALIKHKNKGILLAALGGTGKTTSCCRIPSPWKVLCDDTTLVVYDSNKRRFWAHPLPTWSRLQPKKDKVHYHKHVWDIQQHISISAIFFLEQSKTDEVIPLAKGEAAMKTYSSYEQAIGSAITTDNEKLKRLFRKELFENACNFAEIVPCFTLRLTIDGQFWKEIEKVL